MVTKNNTAVDTKDIDRNPWDKREDESSKAFHAFLCYLRQGPRRSIRETCRLLCKRKKGKPVSRSGQITQWSQRHAWLARASSHDSHIAAVEFQELLEARKQAIRRHLSTASKIEKLADHRLSDPKFQHVVRSARDTLSYAKAAIDIQRDALNIKRNDEQPPQVPQVDIMLQIKLQTDELRERLIREYTERARQQGMLPNVKVIEHIEQAGNASCATDPSLQLPAPETDPGPPAT
jgi:hypothetical protein